MLLKKKLPMNYLKGFFSSLLTFAGNLIPCGKILHDEATFVVVGE